MAVRWAIVAALLLGCAGARGTQLPEHPQIQLANEAFDRHHYKHAARLYREVLESDADVLDERFYVKYALSLFLSRQFEKCVDAVDHVGLVAYEDSAQLREFRALCLWALGRRGPAIRWADDAVRLDPERYEAQYLRARFYRDLDPATCVEAIDAYLRWRPNRLAEADAYPKRLRVICLLRALAGPADEHARRDDDLPPCEFGELRVPGTNECLASDSDFMKLYEAGRKSYAAGALDQAIESFAAARKLQPAMPGPWRWLAVLYEQTGRYSECLDAARMYLRIAPGTTNRGSVMEARMRCSVKNRLGASSRQRPAPPSVP